MYDGVGAAMGHDKNSEGFCITQVGAGRLRRAIEQRDRY